MNQFPSIGLATILNELVTEGDKVLDLGAFARGTSDAFLNLKCGCHFEDLGEYIETLEENDSSAIEKLEEFLIPKPQGTKFDYILAWDLFNYLDLEVIGRIMKLLEPHMKPGTILHCMQYIGTSQPEKPRKFRLLADHKYETIGPDEEKRIPARGYLILDLLKHMNRFSLNITLMNQQGMQTDVVEYLLEYDKSVEEKKLTQARNAPVVAYFKHQFTYSNIRLPQLTRAVFRCRTNEELSIFNYGTQSGEEHTFLKQISKYVYMEDIYSSIAWNKKVAVGSQGSLSDQLLRFSNDVRFDLVLLWDLFNYCEPEQIQKIVNLFSQKLTPNGKIHLLLFNQNRVADKPARFHINKDLSVNVAGQVKGDRPNQITCTGELIKLMPDFKMYGHHYGWFEEKVNFHEFVLEYRG